MAIAASPTVISHAEQDFLVRKFPFCGFFSGPTPYLPQNSDSAELLNIFEPPFLGFLNRPFSVQTVIRSRTLTNLLRIFQLILFHRCLKLLRVLEPVFPRIFSVVTRVFDGDFRPKPDVFLASLFALDWAFIRTIATASANRNRLSASTSLLDSDPAVIISERDLLPFLNSALRAIKGLWPSDRASTFAYTL